MTRLAVAAVFSLVSFDASAIVRYMVQGMTCAEVGEALERDGVAILFRPGKSGVTLYDRFVKDGVVLCGGLHDRGGTYKRGRYRRLPRHQMY